MSKYSHSIYGYCPHCGCELVLVIEPQTDEKQETLHLTCLVCNTHCYIDKYDYGAWTAAEPQNG